MKNGLLIVLMAALAGTYAGGSVDRRPLCPGFLPENTMKIPVHRGPAELASGLNERQFNEILDRIQAEYQSQVSSHGAVLTIEREWTDGTVNAFADRAGNKWILSMYGGLARYPGMTYDGFAAIACHETGHHLGGAPLFTGDDWASVEGESDYYATAKCIKRLFAGDDNERILNAKRLDPEAVKQCEAEHAGKQDQLLCIRAAMAAVDLASILASLDGGEVPKLTTPDPKRVAQTYEPHPEAQCRLDAYFQGALCRVPYSQVMSNTDYHVGSCADPRTYTRGLRPRCWFAP